MSKHQIDFRPYLLTWNYEIQIPLSTNNVFVIVHNFVYVIYQRNMLHFVKGGLGYFGIVNTTKNVSRQKK